MNLQPVSGEANACDADIARTSWKQSPESRRNDARQKRSANVYFAASHGSVEVWHLTGNTPRQPVDPHAGEKVALWFATTPVTPGLDLYIVIENNRADDLDEMPRVVKATWKHDNNGSSYWRGDIGPFEQGDTVAYFTVGNRDGRETICGHDHWFRVRPAYQEAA
jgi:hypothetical protein